MSAGGGRNRIRTVARCRPVTDEDYQCCRLQRHLLSACVGVKSDRRTVVVTKDTYNTKEILLDQAYGVSADQEHIYDQACKDVVADAFAGYNGSILSYGQTGSGKSHTMFGGGLHTGPSRGMVQHALEDIFALMDDRRADGLFCALQVSMFQIYQEGITDLLVQQSESSASLDPFSSSFERDDSHVMFLLRQRLLDIREYPDGSLVVDGLGHHPVARCEDALQLLGLGLSNRITRGVAANEQSSRSHVILQLTVTCQDAVQDGYSQKVRTSRLLCVDLAGSERVRKSGSINDARTMSEAQSINKSISTLGLCIHTLAAAGDRGVPAAHVPFRNSKLTRVLSESLGGRARACVIATVGPCLYNVEETLSTLQFAKRCTAVKKTVRRVRAKLPDLFDDQLIAWTWQARRRSPESPLSPRAEPEPESDGTGIGPDSPPSTLGRLFADCPPPAQARIDALVESAAGARTPQSAASPPSGGSVRWVRYSSDASVVSMFTAPEDDRPPGGLQRGLLVLLPESSLGGGSTSSVTIETGVHPAGGDLAVSVRAVTQPAGGGPAEAGAVADAEAEAGADAEAEELFELFDDGDDEDCPLSARRGSLAVSSSSGSPRSVGEAEAEGGAEPEGQGHGGATTQDTPVRSMLGRPVELLEPEQGPFPPHSTAAPPPPLEMLNAGTTGINSPVRKDRRAGAAAAAGWLGELSSIFEGEPGAGIRSPARRLSGIGGAPPVVPALDIPARDPEWLRAAFSSDSFDSDELGTDRSDFMAKMTDSPPAPPHKRLPEPVEPAELVDIDEKIETIKSTQETIKFILLRLNELHLEGEKKLAELTALKHRGGPNKNWLRISSGDSDDEFDEEDSGARPSAAERHLGWGIDSDSSELTASGRAEEAPSPQPPLSPRQPTLPLAVHAIEADLCGGETAGESGKGPASPRLPVEMEMPADEAPTSARSEGSCGPLSGRARRGSVGPGTHRAMARRHSSSDILSCAQPRRSSMSEYLLASSPTQTRRKGRATAAERGSQIAAAGPVDGDLSNADAAELSHARVVGDDNS